LRGHFSRLDSTHPIQGAKGRRLGLGAVAVDASGTGGFPLVGYLSGGCRFSAGSAAGRRVSSGESTSARRPGFASAPAHAGSVQGRRAAVSSLWQVALAGTVRGRQRVSRFDGQPSQLKRGPPSAARAKVSVCHEQMDEWVPLAGVRKAVPAWRSGTANAPRFDPSPSLPCLWIPGHKGGPGHGHGPGHGQDGLGQRTPTGGSQSSQRSGSQGGQGPGRMGCSLSSPSPHHHHLVGSKRLKIMDGDFFPSTAADQTGPGTEMSGLDADGQRGVVLCGWAAHRTCRHPSRAPGPGLPGKWRLPILGGHRLTVEASRFHPTERLPVAAEAHRGSTPAHLSVRVPELSIGSLAWPLSLCPSLLSPQAPGRADPIHPSIHPPALRPMSPTHGEAPPPPCYPDHTQSSPAPLASRAETKPEATRLLMP